jgi:hypothetical protein
VEAELAEFRKGIAHHRAEGATEERIKQILSASMRLAVQEVDDPELLRLALRRVLQGRESSADRDEPPGKPDAALMAPLCCA